MKRTRMPNKPGIYQIQSKVNGKIYIGGAINLKARKTMHLQSLKDFSHVNPHLQRHYNKYGINDLQFSILKFCPKESLIEREQYYMDLLKPKFNIYLTAGSALGIKRSEKIKQRMKDNHADFSGVNHPMYGKKHAPHKPHKRTKHRFHKGTKHKHHKKPRFANRIAWTEERRIKTMKTIVKKRRIKILKTVAKKYVKYFLYNILNKKL